MKILYVIANLAPRYGGPPKACFEMARAMAELGHNVSIYTTNQDGPTELKVPIGYPSNKDDVEIRYFPIQRPRFWGFSFPLAIELQRETRLFDIVHIHSLYLFHNLISSHYCRKYDVPYLISPHGALDPLIYKRHRFRKSLMEILFERRNFKYSYVVNFATEEEMKRASRSRLMWKAESTIVPIGINLCEYENLPEYGSFRSEYPEIEDNKIVLFFGRINFIKGLEILAEAFSEVADFRSDVILVIAGPDNEGYGNKIKQWLAEKGISDRVKFTGMLQGKDKLSILRDADIFVQPSFSENFGISVIEAMACEIPVVISDRVNIWREVSKKGAGLVIPCDANKLAKSILQLLDNSVSARRMGLKGKLLVKEQFEWSKIAPKLENVYRNIMDNKSVRPCRSYDPRNQRNHRIRT